MSDHDSELSQLDLTAAYSELQKLLLQGADLDDFLTEVAKLAAAVTKPPCSCGIMLRLNNEISTVATSSELALQVDEIQYGHGQGPCLESLRSGRIVHVADLAQEDRWVRYRENAIAKGVRSSLSIPLIVNDESLGAMNLYTSTQHEFTADDLANAAGFAAQASTAVALALRHNDQATLEDQLRNAIASRAVIDQALGIVMGQQRCNATEAFDFLRKASQARNLKLSAVAEQLISSVTGEPPHPPRPFTQR